MCLGTETHFWGVSEVICIMCEVSVDFTMAGCLFLELSLCLQCDFRVGSKINKVQCMRD